ncbi:MAG: hypothetical protein LBC96_03320 [Lachnospiraceae bacterium]|nr:hypothetical protein [Lachnospiraceae bacterium]
MRLEGRNDKCRHCEEYHPEAIHMNIIHLRIRHCERSEAIHTSGQTNSVNKYDDMTETKKTTAATKTTGKTNTMKPATAKKPAIVNIARVADEEVT